MIDIIGSPSSNAKAVYFAFLDMGIECKIIKDATEIHDSKKIVLPGVGAFGALSNFLHLFIKIPIPSDSNDSSEPSKSNCIPRQMPRTLAPSLTRNFSISKVPMSHLSLKESEFS